MQRCKVYKLILTKILYLQLILFLASMKKNYFTFLATTFMFCAQLSSAQTFTKLVNSDIDAQPGDWYNAVPADIDNDYLVDLFLSGNPQEAYYNQIDSLEFVYKSGSSFVLQTGNTCVSVSLVDIDNDCDLDVFFPARGTGITSYLYRNDGERVFTRITTGALATDFLKAENVSWGDYDNDGLVDIFVGRQNGVNGGEINWLYKNNGNFAFTKIDTGATALSSKPTVSANWVDIDNDNDLDLFVVNRNRQQNELYINMGGGHFVENDSSLLTNSTNYPVGANWGDFNNDGFQDVFIANIDGDNNELHLNNGDLTFTKVLTGAIVNGIDNTYGGAWADFDNDGDLDLHTGNNSNVWGKNNFLYLNNGDSTFTKITSGPQYTELKETFGNSTTDLNNDGHMDIIDGARYAGPISIFLNNGNSNGFLKLNLLGSSSNKSGIGARVVTKSNFTGKQTRAVNMMTGYDSQSDFSLHFGLGQDTVIDSMWVYWPSGSTCVFTNVTTNAFYNLGEGGCTLDTVTGPSFIDSSKFLNVQFTNTSSGKINSYLWDFGDGDTSTQFEPKHRYSAPGKYQITLTAYDDYCKHRVLRDSIEICPDTTILGFQESKLGTTVTFNDTSNSFAYSVAWDFGDNSTGVGKNISHVYANPGLYNVCLTLTDSCRTKTFCRIVKVCNNALSAGFTSANQAFTTTFTDASTNATSVFWNFGDGNTSTQNNPTHIYANAGTYYVCQSAFGLCDTVVFCDSIDVCKDSIFAGFSYSISGNVVTFTDQSVGATSYLWDFGDGNQSTNPNPTNLFAADTTYTICLTVSNLCKVDSACFTINLCAAQGIARFNSSKLVNTPFGVQFTSLSTNAVKHFWEFGDGSTSTNRNPLKIFSTNNPYNVCLTITDSCNSKDSSCATIIPNTIGLEEFTVLNNLHIFPNPVKDILIIEQDIQGKLTIDGQLFTLDGKLLNKFSFATGTYTLSVKDLPKGVYILQLTNNGESRMSKIVKE